MCYNVLKYITKGGFVVASHTYSPEAHSRAVTKYIKKNIDRIEMRVTKESGLKETITNHAAAMGESLNAFITRAVIEQMKRDSEAIDKN
jgi:predicted HicB family RNase H-like nuclease